MVDSAVLISRGDGTLTARQTCDALGIGYDTLRKWLEKGKIKSIKKYGLRLFEGLEVARVKGLMRPKKGLKQGQSFLPLNRKAGKKKKNLKEAPHDR